MPRAARASRSARRSSSPISSSTAASARSTACATPSRSRGCRRSAAGSSPRTRSRASCSSGGDDFTVWAEPNLVRASLGVMMLTSDGAEHARQRRPFDEPFRRAPRARALRRARARHIDALLERARPARRLRARRGVRRAVRDRARGRRARAPARRRRARAGVLRGVRRRDGLRRRSRAAAPRRRRARRAERDPARGGASARARGPTTRSRARSPTIPRAGSRTTRSRRSCASSSSARSRPSSRRSRTPCCLLLRNPGELAALRAEPELAGNAIEEGMRLIPPVAFIERWTAAPLRARRRRARGRRVPRRQHGGGQSRPGRLRRLPSASRCGAATRATTSRSATATTTASASTSGACSARRRVTALFERLPGLELVHAPEPAGFAFRRPATLELRWG